MALLRSVDKRHPHHRKVTKQIVLGGSLGCSQKTLRSFEGQGRVSAAGNRYSQGSTLLICKPLFPLKPRQGRVREDMNCWPHFAEQTEA